MNSAKFADPCLELHFQGHVEGITQIRFNSEGNKIASSSLDSTVIIWDLKETSRCLSYTAQLGRVYGLSWSPKSNLLASCSHNRKVKIWEPKSHGGITEEFLAHSKPVRSVDFHPAGTMIITASDDKSLKLWRVPQRKFLTSFNCHTNWVRSAKFSPNGKFVASCGDDKALRIFDINTGSCICCFTEELGMGRQLAWHPNGKVVAVALSCNRVKLFDLSSQELIQLYKVHDWPVNDLAFHPNGNFMLTGSNDETMKILDLLEGRPIYTLTGHIGGVTAVAFNHDGSRFASAGSDKQLLVWKSNLHTYDLSVDDVEQQNEYLAVSDLLEYEEKAATGNSKIINPNDESFMIDSHHVTAFKSNERNLQVPDCSQAFKGNTGKLQRLGCLHPKRRTDFSRTQSSNNKSDSNSASSIATSISDISSQNSAKHKSDSNSTSSTTTSISDISSQNSASILHLTKNKDRFNAPKKRN
uniref:Uncharacterized protein n=1 Tax=Glossina brevipalpis TaxID=37001 RepID=A0A1A9WBB6_9MUSC